MFKQWLESYRQRQALAHDTYVKELKVAMDVQYQKVVKATEKMTSKPCPFQDVETGTCQTACIHFQKGYAIDCSYEEDFQVRASAVYPVCKLWRG